MTVRVYSSADAGAPTLTGQAGSLTNLLDKVLVEGYGTTVPAGWAVAFTATDKRAYRAAAGVRAYLRVDDAAASGAQYANVRGYATMSDVDTGTEPFPTEAQNSTWVATKSSAASTASRGWTAFADDRFIWLFANVNGSTWTKLTLAFGDIVSLKPSDNFGAVIAADRTRATSPGASHNRFGALDGIDTQFYLLRAADEVSGAALATSVPINLSNAITSSGIGRSLGNYLVVAGNTGGENYPSPVTGQASIAPVLLMERPLTASAGFRGYLPGMYQPLHTVSALNSGDRIDGGVALAGRQLQMQQFNYGSNLVESHDARAYIDITGGWR